MTRPVRVGAQIWAGGAPDYRTYRDAVLRAEDIGCDVVFGYDHFHRPAVRHTPGGIAVEAVQPDVTHFEAWTALASWAEITTRVEIGLLVTGIGYRNPDLLADMARTVDHISGGRVILGVGAGWYEKDYRTYGYEYGTVGSRMDTLADGLDRIERRLAVLDPPPLRPVPILVGGAGERRTLPLVARYADIWHCGLDPATFRHRNGVLRRHVAAAGRDDGAIERATRWTAGTADALLAEGATLFVTEVRPTDAGYDLAALRAMVAWRDALAGRAPVPAATVPAAAPGRPA